MRLWRCPTAMVKPLSRRTRFSFLILTMTGPRGDSPCADAAGIFRDHKPQYRLKFDRRPATQRVARSMLPDRAASHARDRAAGCPDRASADPGRGTAPEPLERLAAKTRMAALPPSAAPVSGCCDAVPP